MTREDTILQEEATGANLSEAEGSSAVEIVAGILGGDQSAETHLVVRYARGVRRVLGRHLNNSADVEDLLQDVWLTALLKIRQHELKNPEKLKGFLCGIARRHASNLRNKSQRQATMTDGDRTDVRRAPADGPAERLDRFEKAELVRRVLDELPISRDRELLVRFLLRGEDKATVCAVLGMTATQFNGALFRAKRRFKALLEQLVANKQEEKERRS